MQPLKAVLNHTYMAVLCSCFRINSISSFLRAFALAHYLGFSFFKFSR